MSTTVAVIGWWVALAALVGSLGVVIVLLSEVAGAYTVVKTHVWWTISREKAEGVAARYRRLVQLREMGWWEAFQAYEREVGCLHLSKWWSPDGIAVLNEYYRIDRAHRIADYEREFGPWPFQ